MTSASSAFDMDAFGRRHIGTASTPRPTMLAALGYDSVEALVGARSRLDRGRRAT